MKSLREKVINMVAQIIRQHKSDAAVWRHLFATGRFWMKWVKNALNIVSDLAGDIISSIEKHKKVIIYALSFLVVITVGGCGSTPSEPPSTPSAIIETAPHSTVPETTALPAEGAAIPTSAIINQSPSGVPTEPPTYETEEPTEEQTINSEAQNQDDMVWISKKGKKYHAHPDCSNMKNPVQITVDDAIELGLDPCSKCY